MSSLSSLDAAQHATPPQRRASFTAHIIAEKVDPSLDNYPETSYQPLLGFLHYRLPKNGNGKVFAIINLRHEFSESFTFKFPAGNINDICFPEYDGDTNANERVGSKRSYVFPADVAKKNLLRVICLLADM